MPDTRQAAPEAAMDEGAQGSFAEFVAVRQRSLLRLAFLTTGDRVRAQTLLRTALRRTCRHWERISRTGNVDAFTRRAVVGAGSAAGPSARDDLGRALWTLPPGVRAAVLLRFSEDLSAAEAAEVLGCPESTVATRAARGLDRLTDAIGISPLDPPEPAVRRRLRMLAEGAGEPVDEADLLARELARDAAAHRRHGRVLAVAGVAAALLAAAVPWTLRSPDQAPSRPAAARAESSTGGTPSVVDRSIYSGLTRGSLADDGDFVEGVQEVRWTVPMTDSGLPEAALNLRHVVFAGDVADGRWALVVGLPVDPDAMPEPWNRRGERNLAGIWLTGPPGAAPTEMSPAAGPTMVTPGVPTALLDPVSGTLVVVAAPGDAVEVSTRPDIAADGSSTRSFEPVETDDGVAVVQLDPARAPYGDSVTYRVLEGGRDGPPADFLSLLALPMPVRDPVIDFPPGTPDGIGRLAARYAADRALSEVGLPRKEVELTARWVGDVPEGGPGQAAVVAVGLPSGALLVDSHWLLESPDGTTQGGDCGRDVLPAGVPLERRVLALSCDAVTDVTGRPIGARLVVLAPPEVALIRAYDTRGEFIAEHLADDGEAVLGLPLGTEFVEAVTSGGVSLGRVELLGRRPVFSD